MSGGIQTIQIDRQAAPPAGCVVARGGLASPAGNGPRALSPSNTFAGVAPSQASVIARGRMGSPTRVSAARTQVHVEQLLGHDATCMGAGGQLVGPPLILDRPHDVLKHTSPITHHQSPARPACRDGGVMRDPHFGVAFERNCEMNRHAQ